MKKTWLCVVCGYVHEGDAPPEICPVCGAAQDEFKLQEETSSPKADAVAREGKEVRRVIIVGAGMAGLSAAEAARHQAPHAEIILFSQEPHLPYYRLNLSRYLAGEVTRSDLVIHPASWFEKNRIEWREGTVVKELNPSEHSVTGAFGTEKADALVLTTGATAFRPPFEGAQQDEATTFRTVEDAERILEWAK
ncbi:MAG: FAD-dependent oxidoreductase, partial [Lentisphaerota bacterium]